MNVTKVSNITTVTQTHPIVGYPKPEVPINLEALKEKALQDQIDTKLQNEVREENIKADTSKTLDEFSLNEMKTLLNDFDVKQFENGFENEFNVNTPINENAFEDLTDYRKIQDDVKKVKGLETYQNSAMELLNDT